VQKANPWWPKAKALEDRDTKSSYDAVLLGENGQVKEVRFSGQKRVFVFKRIAKRFP